MKKIILIAVIFMFSCQRSDIENVTISGIVKNEKTNEPLEGVEVILICWKYGNSPDQSYSEDEKVTVKTNSKGKYSHKFNKGAYIEVKVSIPDFKEYHEAKDVYSKKNVFNISLNPLN